jgi:hypothetical protein
LVDIQFCPVDPELKIVKASLLRVPERIRTREPRFRPFLDCESSSEGRGDGNIDTPQGGQVARGPDSPVTGGLVQLHLSSSLCLLESLSVYYSIIIQIRSLDYC